MQINLGSVPEAPDLKCIKEKASFIENKQVQRQNTPKHRSSNTLKQTISITIIISLRLSSDEYSVKWSCDVNMPDLFQHTFDKDNCVFREQILADGYNIYISDQHGTLLSLGNHRQRQQGLDRDVPALAQFLPRISTLQQGVYPVPDPPHQMRTMQTEKTLDATDTFGQLSKIIHSPSFNKRWGRTSPTAVKSGALGWTCTPPWPTRVQLKLWLTSRNCNFPVKHEWLQVQCSAERR